jgi:hypothetical protein
MAVGYQRLAQAVRDGSEARPNFDDGYRVTRALEGVERSWSERRWVSLGD